MNRMRISSIEQRFQDTGQAFDSVAPEYDGPLGNNRLVQHMREVLWHTVEGQTKVGAHLLDLGCGTGLDAVYFAQKGYRVTAIDWSAGMVAQTLKRQERSGVGQRLTAIRLGIQEIDHLAGDTYDLIYSNLGALNCLPDLAGIAQACASLLRSGGCLVFSVIGRICPWELAYYGARANWRRAGVRFSKGQVPVGLNGHTAWTRYYTPVEFYRSFHSHFEWRACRALNLFLPPPYLAHFIERHSSLMRSLAWLDEHMGGLPVLNQTGDHFMLEMVRRD